MKFPLTLLLVVVAMLATDTRGQTTRLVPQQFPTIQAAIGVAVNGDTVVVAPGTYNESINFFGKDLVVMSSMGPVATIISGNSSGRVVTMGSTLPSTAVLDGFTVTGGNGGIILDSNSATIKNCIVKNNATTGTWGGGGLVIVCQPGFNIAPKVLDCSFVGNYAVSSGGGLFIDLYPGSSSPGTCFADIQRCTFMSNHAQGAYTSNYNSGNPLPYLGNGGGGLGARQLETTGTLSVTVTDCNFFYNSASSAGGAACFESVDSALMRNCRIFGNSVGSSGSKNGGGVYCNRSTVDLRNCVIAQNNSAGSGGAVGCYSSGSVLANLNVSSCTITGNTSPYSGGIQLSSGTNTIENSILWGNFPFDVVGVPSSMTYCNLQWATTFIAPSNLSVDPLFVDPANHDYHLSRQSPLVDIGNPFAATTGVADIDGGPRLSGAQIDIGADEVPAAPLDGSGEDLELHTFTATSGDVNETTVNLVAGDLLFLRMTSAGGTFIGSNPLVVGQPYTTGAPPLSPPSLPGIHLDGFMLQLVYGDPSNTFLVGPGLAPEGIMLTYGVPVGLTGFSFRLQGFAITPFALNGSYAVTEAHDLVFQ